MTNRYTYEGCLCWGGDIQTGECDIVATYAVDWGYPERGPSYSSGGEPGEPASVVDIEVVSVNGTPWADYDRWTGLGLTKADALEELVEKLADQRGEEMIEAAIEADQPDPDDARDARYDDDRYFRDAGWDD